MRIAVTVVFTLLVSLSEAQMGLLPLTVNHYNRLMPKHRMRTLVYDAPPRQPLTLLRSVTDTPLEVIEISSEHSAFISGQQVLVMKQDTPAKIDVWARVDASADFEEATARFTYHKQGESPITTPEQKIPGNQLTNLCFQILPGFKRGCSQGKKGELYLTLPQGWHKGVQLVQLDIVDDQGTLLAGTNFFMKAPSVENEEERKEKEAADDDLFA